MSRTVYGLFYFDPSVGSDKLYFYVGRSIDMFRRAKQHNYAKRKGHEDKYEFIRELEEKGIVWHFEALHEISDEEYPPDNERWFVIKLTREGHRLMNMRHGSEEHRRELAEQVLSPLIRNADDVCRVRVQKKYQASKRLRRKVLLSTMKREGIPDVLSDTLLPPIIRRRLIAQNCKSIEKGVTLKDIVGLIRAEPILRHLAASVPPMPYEKDR